MEAKNTKPKKTVFALTLNCEAAILGIIRSALQAPADSTFKQILTWVSGAGLAIIVLGLVTGLIPPPKHVFADSSHIVSLYYDGQKKVITSNASTVGEVLAEAHVQMDKGDLVEPAASTPISAGFFNVNVYRSRPVVVVDGTTHKTLETALQSPELIAKEAGLVVYPEDTYTTETIDNIADAGTVGQTVTVHRALPVVIAGDNVQQQVRTQQKTVGGVLDERDVALGPKDTVTQPRNTPVTANMVIQINRVKVVELKQTEAIAHSSQQVSDGSMLIGTTSVATPGVDGQKTSTFRVHFQNGVETARELLAQQVDRAPVTEVVHVGTKIDLSANPTQLGQQLAAQRGWTGAQWTALYQLWDRESGWNPNSHNGSSGACGIPQAYPCSKITDHSAAGQIRWGLDYIAGKYGDPVSAWAYWQRNHSY